MTTFDLKSNADVVQSLVPATRNGDTNGSGVDLRGYEAAMVVFDTGAITDGTHTPSLEESDDDSTYTTVAAADLQGAFANLAANSVQRVGYSGGNRYIRAQCNSSGTTGAAYSATIVRGRPHAAPLA